MLLFLILYIITYLVGSFISKKSRINNFSEKNPRIKFENLKKHKLPDNFMKNEAIIFNNIVKNIKKNNEKEKEEEKDEDKK